MNSIKHEHSCKIPQSSHYYFENRSPGARYAKKWESHHTKEYSLLKEIGVSAPKKEVLDCKSAVRGVLILYLSLAVMSGIVGIIASDYDQKMPQSQINPRHHEEETQNTYSHITARTQREATNCLFLSEVIQI